MKYRIIIVEDEGMYVAECPSLPGCISQGKTRTEALENIKDAILTAFEIPSSYTKEAGIAPVGSKKNNKEYAIAK